MHPLFPVCSDPAEGDFDQQEPLLHGEKYEKIGLHPFFRDF
jgi:hypothetical protein